MASKATMKLLNVVSRPFNSVQTNIVNVNNKKNTFFFGDNQVIKTNLDESIMPNIQLKISGIIKKASQYDLDSRCI